MAFRLIIKRVILFFIFINTYSLIFGQYTKVTEFKKGDFRLDIKLPWFNHLSLNPERRFKENKFGFVGQGLGMEYNYCKRKYVETSISFATAFHIPFPVHIDKEYNKSLWTFYINITDNFIKNRFTVGYGINYSDNRWIEWIRDFTTWGLTTIRRTEYANKSLGLTFNTYYLLGRTANAGIIYRPSLFYIKNGINFLYEHLISVELMWRFRLFTR